MKKNLLLIIAIFCIATNSFATTYMVSVGGTSFTPSTLTVHPGDMIMWMWTDGTHTTTSTSVPTGAPNWNSDINSTATSFTYIPTVLGTYQYQCTFHVSMGMVGTINVVSPAGIVPLSSATPIFSMYPNPVSGSLHIVVNNLLQPVSVSLTSITGIEVMNKTYSGTKDNDLSINGIPAGTYFITAVQGNAANKQELVVIH